MKLSLSYLYVFLCSFLLFSCQKEVINHSEEIQPEEIASVQSNIRMAIVGDSISTYAGELVSDIDGYQGTKYKVYYPKGDVKKVEDTWWYKLSLLLGVKYDNICNCSWSGSRVTGNSNSTNTASAGCSTKRISDLSYKGFLPDLVICFISCNDWAENVPIGDWDTSTPFPKEGLLTTFKEAYALMLFKIQQHYPSSKVVCLTNLDDKKRDKTPGWPSNNSNGVTIEEWNRSIMEISEALGCFIVNLQDCGIDYNNISKYTIDGGLHPNSAGMTLIARKVASELAPILEELGAES